jgi:hypothetical protein
MPPITRKVSLAVEFQRSRSSRLFPPVDKPRTFLDTEFTAISPQNHPTCMRERAWGGTNRWGPADGVEVKGEEPPVFRG